MLRKTLFAPALIAAMMMGDAVAAPAASGSVAPTKASPPRQAPLPSGGAAPVREAQGIGRPLLYWAVGGIVIISGVILLSQDGDDGATTTTTGTGN